MIYTDFSCHEKFAVDFYLEESLVRDNAKESNKTAIKARHE